MATYEKTSVYLSDSQIKKLQSSLKKGESITLRINKAKPPNHDIYLTKTQIGQLRKGKDITLSKTQLKKNGGFLPFLAPILATIATGALSGAAGWGTKKILDKATGSGVLQNWEGGNIVKQLVNHPVFLEGLLKLVQEFIPKTGGCKQKKDGKGVLQNWELAMRPSRRT